MVLGPQPGGRARQKAAIEHIEAKELLQGARLGELIDPIRRVRPICAGYRRPGDKLAKRHQGPKTCSGASKKTLEDPRARKILSKFTASVSEGGRWRVYELTQRQGSRMGRERQPNRGKKSVFGIFSAPGRGYCVCFGERGRLGRGLAPGPLHHASLLVSHNSVPFLLRADCRTLAPSGKLLHARRMFVVERAPKKPVESCFHDKLSPQRAGTRQGCLLYTCRHGPGDVLKRAGWKLNVAQREA